MEANKPSMVKTINALKVNESAWLVGQGFEGSICFDGSYYSVEMYYPYEMDAQRLTKEKLIEFIVTHGYKK